MFLLRSSPRHWNIHRSEGTEGVEEGEGKKDERDEEADKGKRDEERDKGKRRNDAKEEEEEVFFRFVAEIVGICFCWF